MVVRNIFVFVQENGVNYSNTSKHVTLLKTFFPSNRRIFITIKQFIIIVQQTYRSLCSKAKLIVLLYLLKRTAKL